LLRGEKSSVPSGPPIFTSLDVAPRIALRRSSVAAAKMPRIRFYNRRSRHEHPSETPLSETARRAPWETRRRSTSRPPSAWGFRLLASSGAGPPCGHPTSDSFALDGASPASGSSTTSFFRGSELPYVARAACGRRRCPGFFGRRYLCRFEPSDTSCSAPDKDPRRGAPFFRSLDPHLPGHVNAPTSSRSRCLPSRETAARALSGPCVVRCHRWPAGAAAARFHRGSENRD